jgi:NAD(P)-dependent dehydrogenase (short-subunit alcohol dehydrogenase family)
VAGRREERLNELVGEIEGRGGEALAVRTDVSEMEDVEDLIEQSVERFQSVDVLVNNAGVALTARFADQSLDDFRRLMDVNFWGAVQGCKAVLPQMQSQPHGGVIINISSILGRRGVPFQTAYCASKFALRGFSEALRVEVASSGIDVSTIFPGAVESEIWDAAANQTGMEMPQFVPKFPARDLAQIIVQDARFPQPEIVMALDALALDLANRVAPGLMDLFLGQSKPFMEGFIEAASQGESGRGNLYTPLGQEGEQGAAKPRRRRRTT